MKYTITAAFLVFICSSTAAQPVSVSGPVMDGVTGAPLAGASVRLVPGNENTITTRGGLYTLRVPRGSALITVTHVGYAPASVRFIARQDTVVSVVLRPESVDLAEAEVVASPERLTETPIMGAVQIRVAEIRDTPAILGEVDPIKALDLVPGVQTREGSAGLYVRGGGPDQNLFLLDGMPLYGSTHLLGFLSSFPSEAVESVTLYRGSLPARYGGRLSSVVVVEPRTGSFEKASAQGSVGLLSSQLAIESPFAGGRGSVLVAGRRTFIDLITRTFAPESFQVAPYFVDGYARGAYRVGPRTLATVGLYASRDAVTTRAVSISEDGGRPLREQQDATFGWGTQSGSVILRHTAGRIQTEAGVGALRYRLETRDALARTVEGETPTGYSASSGSSVRDVRAWLHGGLAVATGQTASAGVSVTQHRFDPTASRVDVVGAPPPSSGAPLPASVEWGAYAEHDAEVGPLRATVGVHAALFQLPAAAGGDRVLASVQPRLSARLRVAPDLAVKASFARTSQAVHLLTNSSLGLPSELWLPATADVPPSSALSGSAGVAYEPRAGRFAGTTFTAEAYARRMDGVIAYRDGGTFAGAASLADWPRLVEQGVGRSAGIELAASGTAGRLRWSAAYALSRTTLQFDGISGGRAFPARFDRRHDLGLTARFALRPSLSFQAQWTYASGEALTFPTGEYLSCGNGLPGSTRNDGCTVGFTYGDRGNRRARPYHRLDLAAHFGRETGRWGLAIGVYNAYNRLNPFYVTLPQGGSVRIDGTVNFDERYTRSVTLFPVLPYARLEFRF